MCELVECDCVAVVFKRHVGGLIVDLEDGALHFSLEDSVLIVGEGEDSLDALLNSRDVRRNYLSLLMGTFSMVLKILFRSTTNSYELSALRRIWRT